MDAKMTKTNNNTKCKKCNGHGVIHAYYHNANGRCFKCGGTGLANVTRKVVTKIVNADEIVIDEAAFVAFLLGN